MSAGGSCFGCGRKVANTAANAVGVGVGGRVRWAHAGRCVERAVAKARELVPPVEWKPPAGSLLYARRCPNCGKKVKRGTVQASQGYVWHCIPGREPHLLWTPANLSTEVRA